MHCPHCTDIETQAAAFAACADPPLTVRERVIVRLLLTSLSMRQIAVRVGATEKTMKHHARSIYGKFEVGNRLQLLGRFTGFDDLPPPRISPTSRVESAAERRPALVVRH